MPMDVIFAKDSESHYFNYSMLSLFFCVFVAILRWMWHWINIKLEARLELPLLKPAGWTVFKGEKRIQVKVQNCLQKSFWLDWKYIFSAVKFTQIAEFTEVALLDCEKKLILAFNVIHIYVVYCMLYSL